MRTLLRRGLPAAAVERLETADLVLDLPRRRVTPEAESELALTNREFSLLDYSYVRRQEKFCLVPDRFLVYGDMNFDNRIPMSSMWR